MLTRTNGEMTAGTIPSRTSVKPKTSLASARRCRSTRRARCRRRARILHARHDGSGAAVDCLAHLEEAQRVRDVLLVAEVDGRALPLDVRAGAERLAVPGEDDGARVADVGERLGELGDQRSVERVPPLRAGECDAEDRPVPLHPKRAHVGAA